MNETRRWPWDRVDPNERSAVSFGPVPEHESEGIDVERERRAAEHGNPDAMLDLAQWLLEHARREEAEEWLRRSASAGNASAMRELGRLTSKDGDVPMAKDWFEKATAGGSVIALADLGALHYRQGDRQTAEAWFRKAAEAGSIPGIMGLVGVLEIKGSHDEAEGWIRRLAEEGDPLGMFELGLRLAGRDDPTGELWYRRAAEAGNIKAMINLGILLLRRGDPKGEMWYRRAADAGAIDAMTSLAWVLERRGDLEEAEHWYRTASELGDTTAMCNLTALLGKQDRVDEADEWYQRAADATESPDGMNRLGLYLEDRRRFAEAEMRYRHAAEGGNIAAMYNLGRLCRNSRRLDQAESWFLRAAEAGHEEAVRAAASVRRKIEYADQLMDSVSFDDFGWSLVRDDEGFRVWEGPDAHLNVYLNDFPPPITEWNTDHVRRQVEEGLSVLRSVVAGDSDLVSRELLPESYQRRLPQEAAEEEELLDVELFEIPPAKCYRTFVRGKDSGGIWYAGAVTVCFAEVSWALQVLVQEAGVPGEREAAVAREFIDRFPFGSPTSPEFDPYDRRWDGLVDVGSDPLTRVRLLTERLKDSIRFSQRALALRPLEIA